MRLAQGWHEVGMMFARYLHKVGMRLAQGWDEVSMRLAHG